MPRQIRYAGMIQQAGFVLLFVFPPLAGGATRHWAFCICLSLAWTALSAMLFKRFFQGNHLLLRSSLDLPLVILLLLAFVSFFPSIHQFATGWALLRLLLYGSIFYLSVEMASSKDSSRKLAMIILGVGTLVALVGLSKYLGGAVPSFWSQPSLGKENALNATFVNSNHLAGYLEMVFFLGLGLFACKSLRYRSLWSPALLSMLLAICLSMSRGGWIATVIALGFMSVLFMARRKASPTRIVLISVFVLLTVSLAALSSTTMTHHLGSLENVENIGNFTSRLAVWSGCLEIIRQLPFLGSGLGTFPWAFTPVRPAGLTLRYLEAHNDYLQIVSELGLPVLVPLAWGLVLVFKNGFHAFRSTPDPFRAGLTLGALGGIVAILVHSVSDFNLQITSNGILFSYLLGVCVQAPSAKEEVAHHPSPITHHLFFSSRRSFGTVTVLALAGVLFIWGNIEMLRFTLADIYASLGKQNLSAEAYPAAASWFAKSLRITDANAEYYYLYGDALYGRARENQGVESTLGLLVGARQAYQKATELNPREGPYWYGFAQACWRLAGFEGHAQETQNTESYLLRALATDPNNGKFLYAVANFYLSAGEPSKGAAFIERLGKVYPRAYETLKKHPGWSEDLNGHFMEGLEDAARNSVYSQEALNLLLTVAVSKADWDRGSRYVKELIRLSGDSTPPVYYLQLAEYALNRGDRAEAGAALQRYVRLSRDPRQTLEQLFGLCRQKDAFELCVELSHDSAKRDPRVKSGLPLMLGKAYLANNDPETAAGYFRRSLESGESAEAHRYLAEIAIGKKDWVTAEIESQRATVVDPKDTPSYFLFARALQAQQEYAAALGVIDEALGRCHSKLDGLYDIQGGIYLAMNNTQGAIHAWKEAHRLSPGNVHYLYQLGRAHKSLRDFAGAEQYYLAALALRPEDQGLQQELAAMRAAVAAKNPTLNP